MAPATLNFSSELGVRETVSSLRNAFNEGVTRRISWRKMQIEQLYSMVKDNEDLFYEALSKDLGKPQMEALISEISVVLSECVYFMDNIDRLCKDKKMKPQFIGNTFDKLYKRRESLGVVAIFSAWNFPVMLSLLPLVGAIAAGNAVILKPSEIASNTAGLLTGLIPKYLDNDYCRVINGGPDVSTWLLNERLDYIFYTGSSDVGKLVMRAAAKNLTPVTLELGGKSPAIVTADADIQLVAKRIAFGKFFNAGQTCIGVDYVLIPTTLQNKFLEEMRKILRKRYGEDPTLSKDYAHLISEKHFKRVKHLIDDRQSGDLAIGGECDEPSLYIAPTVITNVNFDDDVLMGEEIFGPVMPVISYERLEEVYSLMKTKEKPLALYVFSNDNAVTMKILENVPSGGVCVNDTLMHHAERALPFGGVGHSGMGNYHGEATFNTFTHERSILMKRQHLEALVDIRYPPYFSYTMQILRTLLVPHPLYMVYRSFRKSVKIISFVVALLAVYVKYRA